MECTLALAARRKSAAAKAPWLASPLIARAKAAKAPHSKYSAPVVAVGYPANSTVSRAKIQFWRRFCFRASMGHCCPSLQPHHSVSGVAVVGLGGFHEGFGKRWVWMNG